jgi:hypothetical protein
MACRENGASLALPGFQKASVFHVSTELYCTSAEATTDDLG